MIVTLLNKHVSDQLRHYCMQQWLETYNTKFALLKIWRWKMICRCMPSYQNSREKPRQNSII